MRAESSVAAALTVVYKSAHVKGAVQESRGNRATHELSWSFLIRELQQEKAWSKTRDTCTRKRNQTSRKAEIPTWIALPKVATNFLPCPSRKNGGNYSAPQLKSHLWDWGPCENYLKRVIKTSLLLYLTPPQVLHATLTLTQPLWDSMSSPNITGRSTPQTVESVRCRICLLPIHCFCQFTADDGSISHLHHGPCHQLPTCLGFVFMTETALYSHTKHCNLPSLTHTHLWLPLCRSTSPSLNLSPASKWLSLQELQLYQEILFISCSVPKPSPAPCNSTAACGCSCREALAPILHFVWGAKCMGIAFSESYYIYDNLFKLCSVISVSHSWVTESGCFLNVNQGSVQPKLTFKLWCMFLGRPKHQ